MRFPGHHKSGLGAFCGEPVPKCPAEQSFLLFPPSSPPWQKLDFWLYGGIQTLVSLNSPLLLLQALQREGVCIQIKRTETPGQELHHTLVCVVEHWQYPLGDCVVQEARIGIASIWGI